MKVTVIGQGYVGQSVAFEASKVGHQVVGLDVNQQLIDDLKNSITFVPGINKNLLTKLVSQQSYKPTTDPQYIDNSDVIIIAVPTPLDKNRKPDFKFLESACNVISSYAKNSTLVVNESTSFPGTLRNFIKPLIEKNSNASHLYSAAPERVDPGNTKWGIRNTPRVISGLSQESISLTKEFYESFCENIYTCESVEVAEAAKLFENTFRQINIALVNEFSEISHKIGFSAHEAITAAATKPFGFMPFFPSVGVGGHCIPVDPSYLSFISKEFGVEAKFINLANEVNSMRPKNIALRIVDELGGSLINKRIQIAGISYKIGVSDLRESPALQLMIELMDLGAEVSWCDPLVEKYNNQTSEPLDSDIHLGLIVTPHSEIDFNIWKKANVKVLDLSANSNNYGWPKFL
jgi:UDP-N-acetyl-D-glucosamine dehydrogenase